MIIPPAQGFLFTRVAWGRAKILYIIYSIRASFLFEAIFISNVLTISYCSVTS